MLEAGVSTSQAAPREPGPPVAKWRPFLGVPKPAPSFQCSRHSVELLVSQPRRAGGAVAGYEVPVPLLCKIIGYDRFEPREVPGTAFCAWAESALVEEVAQARNHRILTRAFGGVHNIDHGPVGGVDAFLAGLKRHVIRESFT